MARKNSSYRKVLFFCLLFIAIVAMAKTEKRVALIWGNAEYDGWMDLPQCTHDADTIADRLWKLGFDTLMLKNGNKSEMESSLYRFEERMKGAEVVVFFYSGHAFNKNNYYLVPSKTRIDEKNPFAPHCFNASEIFYVMKRNDVLSLLFFDACRIGDGDLEDEGIMKGIKRIPHNIGHGKNQPNKPYGYAVYYATKNDGVARTGSGEMSIFSRVLANHIADNNEFDDVFWTISDSVYAITEGDQRPYRNHNYRNSFYFNPPKMNEMESGIIDSVQVYKEQAEKYKTENEMLKAELKLSNLRLERCEFDAKELAYSQKNLSGETSGTQEDWTSKNQTEWEKEYNNALETRKEKEKELLQLQAQAKTQDSSIILPPRPKRLQIRVDGIDRIGIDISKHQGNINWKNLLDKHKNIEFVYIKATEGSDYVDPCYRNNITNARKAGIKVGSYHFLSTRSPITTQFENFVNTLKIEDQDLIPVIDCENIRPWTSQQVRDSLRVFVNLVEEYYGVKPMIYTSEKFFTAHLGRAFYDYPLWIAKYSESAPNIGTEWTLWQFTDRASISGISHNRGEVDASVYNKKKSINDLLIRKKKKK